MKSRQLGLLSALDRGCIPVISLYAQNARWTPLVRVGSGRSAMAAASILVWLVLFLVVRQVARAALAGRDLADRFRDHRRGPGVGRLVLTELSWLVGPAKRARMAASGGRGRARGRDRVDVRRGAAEKARGLDPVAQPLRRHLVRDARYQHRQGPAEAAGRSDRSEGRHPSPRPRGDRTASSAVAPTSITSSSTVTRAPTSCRSCSGSTIEPFLKRLEQKGFYVARRSTANYCQTPLSLSSSLNAVYLNGPDTRRLA